VAQGADFQSVVLVELGVPSDDIVERTDNRASSGSDQLIVELGVGLDVLVR
jgi:hypothetical protein